MRPCVTHQYPCFKRWRAQLLVSSLWTCRAITIHCKKMVLSSRSGVVHSLRSGVLQHRYGNQIREGGHKFEHLKSLRQVHSNYSGCFNCHEACLRLQA